MTSTADASDVVEVADDGVSITKTYAAEEFPVPAIKFELASERDEPVTVRFTEEIPSSFSMDGVGFHPDFHSDQWTAYQDNRVEFTGQVDPDESLVTVYGVKLDDEELAADFLTEPTIADVRSADSEPEERDPGERPEPVADTTIDDIVSEDRNQVVKDMLSGEATGVPGLDDEDADDIAAGEGLDLDLSDVDTDPVEVDDDEDEDEDAPDIDLDFEEEIPEEAPSEEDETSDDEPEITLDLDAAAESLTESETDETETDEADETPAAKPDAVDADDESLAAALAAEIRSGNVADEDLAAIEDALGTAENGPERARIDHLQSRVEEVAAYTAALETFLEEEGTGEQLIREFRTRLETFESDLEAVTGRLDETESTVSAIETSVEDVESSVDRTEETVADVSEEVDAFEEDLTEVTSAVDDLDEEVSDLDDDVEELDVEVDDLADQVDDLDEDLSDVDERVTDLVEWRDQLGSMFSD